MPVVDFTPGEAAALLRAIAAYSRPDNAFLDSAGEKLREIVARDLTRTELAGIRSGGPVPLDVALSLVIARFVYDAKHSEHFNIVHEMVFRGLDPNAADWPDRAATRIRRAFPSIAHETAADLDETVCLHSVLGRSKCRSCIRDYLEKKFIQYGATVSLGL